MRDIEPILGPNLEKIDLEVKKLDFDQKNMPIIYFLISLKTIWTCGLLQMLLPILYLHTMRYRTDPVTTTRKK